MDMVSLHDKAKNYSVLYVEDEEEIRFAMERSLKRVFKEVYIATNGEEGFKSFMSYHPDLVITDIQMPFMSGLEMAKLIHEENKECPIIITTAYNDTEFLVTAIEAKVDFFLFKPLEMTKVWETLGRVLEKLHEKSLLDEYRRQKNLYKINNASLHAIFSAMEGAVSPSLLMQHEQPIYMNKAWHKIIDTSWIDRFFNDQVNINDLFVKKEGYIHSLNDISSEHIPAMIYRGKQSIFFLITSKDVYLEEDSTRYTLYTFTDITMLEYQKNKLANMNKLLKEFMVANYYNCPLTPLSPLKKERVHQENNEVSTKKRSLNDDEQEVLRRNHKQHYSAKEYISELDSEILQELDELAELEQEMKDILDELEQKRTPMLLEALALRCYKYASTLKLLLEFNDLGFALRSIAQLLEAKSLESLEAKAMDKIIVYLQNIISDLSSWRDTLFVSQETLDIHYLDSSLFSVCLQLEMLLSNKNEEIDEDFLELF